MKKFVQDEFCTEEKSAIEEQKFKVKFKEVTVQIGKYIDILRNLFVQKSKILRI